MATKTPQTPNPPPEASARRSLPPPPLVAAASMLSPSFLRNSLRAFPSSSASAAAAAAGPVPFPTDDWDERPCFKLFDWWLERVEGDDRKVRVAGHTERNRRTHVFTSAPIVKRHEACFLEAEDSSIVLIDGPLDLPQMEANGYSLEVCEKFMIGFPYFWESYNLGSQTSCSNTSNSQDGPTKFYLEKFQLGNFIDKVGSSFLANLLNNVRIFSGDGADSFEKGSCLSNKKPRFEEWACDLDISAKEKATAFNGGSKGSPAVCNKVGNGRIDLIAESTSKERDHDNIHLNASLTSIEEFTREKTSEEAGNQNEFIYPDAENQEAGSHLVNSDLIYDRSTDDMPCEMGDGSANAGSSVGQGSKEFLATVPPERANFSSEGCLDDILPTSTFKSKDCLENQGCLEISQHITLNKEVVVPNEDMSTSVHSDVESLGNPVGPEEEQRSERDVLQGAPRSPKQHVGSPQEQRSEHCMLQGATRSRMVRTPLPYGHCSPLTRAKAKLSTISTPESLKLRRTRSGRVVVPPLDHGCQRIVYDRDGLVSGVAGLELQSHLKGSKSRTPARKRRAH
ncbi:hypothetical protein E2562_027294 [Oryza meyeriana var. granulata]|uniref:SANTA domain-containing protein n=1 Tax=Oryza meyeriana var. granulata TaxID=110450 RepID=A0A6G1BYZ4_9ORYZ|nr:hypothetical protein E2562_027294 [Oryza meyeriana var. granulata]